MTAGESVNTFPPKFRWNQLIHSPRNLGKKSKSADYVRERVWARQQRLEECPDGSLILEITTTSEPELMSFVRSFGEEATLLSKADLPMEKPSELL